MKALRIAIIGSSGRMGTEILGVISENKNLKASVGVSEGASSISHPSLEEVRSLDKLDPKKVDVVIDFSSPSIFKKVVSWCVKHKKPLVSGTTGITAQDMTAVKRAGASIPVLWAPNMSLGVAIMAQMFKSLKGLEGFEFQVEELHHKRKVDKPSGTALFLQERLEEAVEQKLPDPLAIRGGGIFGIHRVWAMGEEETITIEHTAMNRKVFARGAVRAAEWIVDKRKGVYRMVDVLGVD